MARCAALSGLLLSCCIGPPDGDRGLRFDAERSTFVVAPVPKAEAAASRALSVFVGEPRLDGCRASDGQPPLLGSVERIEDMLVFYPRTPWRRDLSYTACFDPTELGLEGDPQNATLPATSKRDTPPPEITAIWPPAGEVPANLLRFYVFFDQPMVQRGLDRHIELVQAGRTLEDALVSIPEGLWDASSQRLTLFLHPGRIKRGVGPRQALGPALEESADVTLRLHGLRAAAGGMLETHESTFRVVAEDRSSPDPERWRIASPAHGTREPLEVQFDEPLDLALAQRMLTVQRGVVPVAGVPSVEDGARSWSFVPEDPWQRGDYELSIDARIEDLAGNRPGRLFDRPLTDDAPIESPILVSVSID